MNFNVSSPYRPNQFYPIRIHIPMISHTQFPFPFILRFVHILAHSNLYGTNVNGEQSKRKRDISADSRRTVCELEHSNSGQKKFDSIRFDSAIW